MDRKQIESNIEEFKVREQTLSKIKKAGLPIPERPADIGVDLFTEWEQMKRRYGGTANIPFRELGDFLDRWTQMLSYARWAEAVADIDQSTAKEIRDMIRKQLYILQDGNREYRDAAVYKEPLFIQWEKKFVEDNALFTTLRALREGYEYRVNAISREITRRSNDNLDTRRNINRGSGQ